MDTTIHNKILPGEEILWEGQPRITRSFNISIGCSSLFGIIWLAFSLFWTIGAFLATRGAMSSGGSDAILAMVFPLFGLPFVAIGIYMVFWAPRKQKLKDKATYYYVTNRRIIINIDTQKSPTFNSVYIHDLNGIKTVKNMDNTGSIIFENHFTNRTYSSGRNSSSNFMPAVNNCFYRIADVDDVYKLILMRQEIADLKSNQ